MANELHQIAKAPPAANEMTSARLFREHASNELIFAVVGHVGSGVSDTAKLLVSCLQDKGLPGGAFEVHLLKARDEILRWAEAGKRPLPTQDKNDLAYVDALQNLGDAMREAGDHAAVARSLVRKIRSIRAQKQGKDDAAQEAIVPDGVRRAYVLDSIRHPAEVHLLRNFYQSAFTLVGVVCEEDRRQRRIVAKYKNAGDTNAQGFMQRDAKAGVKHGQRVSDAFHLADVFLDNSAERVGKDRKPNRNWNIPDQLSRVIKIITHSEIVRPTPEETAMHAAYGAQMRSACLSRQVGAAVIDGNGNIIATGTNEVPQAGGGVYGETALTPNNDHRCAFRPMDDGKPHFCANTVEQNEIVEGLIKTLVQEKLVKESDAGAVALQLRNSRIGGLLEFSRAVHAEMDALLSVARLGTSTKGTRLFVTTFPCHYCARHVVSAGIDEVQYIEPYPKSRALKLHSDSISIDPEEWLAPSKAGQQVLFRPFTGVAPRTYARAFLKDRDLKDDETGIFRVGEQQWASPWDIGRVSYAQLEAALGQLKEE